MEPREKKIHLLFDISVILKGLNAAVEFIGGILILFLTHPFLSRVITFLTHEEISEDPKDFIASHLIAMGQQFSVNTKIFGAIYLISHGLIKLALVVGLLKKKLWAYPLSIFFLIIFIIYQLYRYAYTHSVWLIALSIFDVLATWLIWHEYRLLKKHLTTITSQQ